ncbi:MAG TPA: hypothetical protein VL977_02550, partial [Solirubrobacteraceae bacterium]|nr:hypothetical protein [Solirubrobacteraceae bacterium]
ATGPTSAPAPRARHPEIGIGDNNVYLFADPRFRALGIRTVRDDVPWDVIARGGFPVSRLTAWLDDARAQRLSVLISFDHDTGNALPTVAEFSAAFEQFHRRYPWVRQFVTWDEANFFSEPTAGHVHRAVGFYRALLRDCRGCTILAPDLLDLPRFAVPAVRYARRFIRDLGYQPPIWALNDYVGANRMSVASTAALLAAVTGKVWIAEVAGVISNGSHVTIADTRNLAHAAAVDRFILDRIAALSPRIQRIYLYEWRATPGPRRWDSALISANGQARPAYYVLARVLAGWGIEPRCAISSAPPACASGAGG